MEGKSDSGRKTSKTRRETAVQGTNDSSIVSKCSTSSCGYFNDPYLHYFVSKLSRRAPLIHRGYYIRAVAFDRLLRNFLGLYGKSKCQIISLGCGFDSSYFRLKAAQLLDNVVFCEIDFPDLVRRKRLLIESTKDLISLVEKTNEEPLSPHIEFSCSDYYLLGVDLTQLNTLEAALKMCGVDFECPTLLLSECVMTYMTRRCSTELVKWAAETFEEAVFGMYEQMNPDDAFGLFMQNHFHSIGSPLKCINSFPSLESQKKRFLNTGWAWCEALDMNTFYYQHVDPQEQRRVESLETFDEYEELNLKYSHYFLLTASTVNLNESLITDGKHLSKTSLHPPIYNILTTTRPQECRQLVRRFGHASSLVHGRFAVSSGGFGEVDGRHQRLAEITITDIQTHESFHIPCGSADVQCSRMHHTSVSLSDGTTFLIGGRQSPYFMCNQVLKVKLAISAQHHKHSPEDKLPQQAHSTEDDPSSKDNEGLLAFGSSPAANQLSGNQFDSATAGSSGANLYSKSASSATQSSVFFDGKRCTQTEPCVSRHLENDSLKRECHCTRDGSANSNNSCRNCGMSNNSLSEDNENSSSVVHSWVFELGQVNVSVVYQGGSLPKERWRQAAVAVMMNGKEKIFMYGGKTKSGEVLEDSFIFDVDTSTWEQITCSGDTPGPRHSHCITFWNGRIVLTGGLDVSHVPCEDIFVLDLATYVWEKLSFEGNLYPRYSHTAHIHEDKLLLVGGVNLHHPPPGVAAVSLRTKKALEFALPNQDKSNLLMFHRHTSVQCEPEKIIVLGGGGNCFSFGTHLNRTPIVLNVSQCIDALG